MLACTLSQLASRAHPFVSEALPFIVVCLLLMNGEEVTNFCRIYVLYWTVKAKMWSFSSVQSGPYRRREKVN